MREWPFVGRQALLDDASRALDMGTSIEIAGVRGVGKTALATQIANRWQQRHGAPVTWLRPVAELRRVPLGAVAVLVGETPVVPQGGDLSEFALSPLAAALVERVQNGLLVVDDAHHLDEASAGLVHQLVSVAGTLAVVTVVNGEAVPIAIHRLWMDELVTRLDVESFGHALVADVLAAALDGPADSTLVDHVFERSVGSPLYVRELVLAALADGVLTNEGGRWRTTAPFRPSERLEALLRARLDAMPDDVRDAFNLVAIAAPVPLHVLEATCGARAVAGLEENHLAAVDAADPAYVHPAHPMIGETGVALLPAATRRELLRRLADLFAPIARTAYERARVMRWRLEGGADMTADALAAGAREALAIGDVDLALRASAAAFDIEPTFANGHLHAVVLLRTERHAEAITALDSVAELATQDKEVVALAQTRAQLLGYGQGRGAEAAAALFEGRQRLASGPDDPLAHMEGALLLYEGRPQDALALVNGMVHRPDAPGRVYGGVVASIAELLSGSLRHCLATCQAVDEAIEQGAQTDPLGDHHMAEVVRLLARAETGELDAVAADGSRYWAAWSAGAAGTPWSHWLAWVLGRVALLRGRAGEAARWLRRSETTVSGSLPALLGAWVAGSRAYAELLVGNAAAAEALAGRPPVASGDPGDDGADRARAWVLASRGCPADALGVLSMRADDLGSRSVHLFEATLRHDLVRLGLADPATVERLGDLSRLIDGDLSAARAAHGVALANGDSGALGTVGERFEAIGAHLFAAEAATQGADLARRRDERRTGGLTSLAARCRERCDVVASPSLAAVANASGLTRREHEIATRAARGEPSKDIAAALGISRRTVDNTLQRAFVKLGVARRGDLAAALAS